MANQQSLREMLSHRVTFTYDTGVEVVGTVIACAPVTGPVDISAWGIVTLRAELP